jgi:hypothetical protein
MMVKKSEQREKKHSVQDETIRRKQAEDKIQHATNSHSS